MIARRVRFRTLLTPVVASLGLVVLIPASRPDADEKRSEGDTGTVPAARLSVRLGVHQGNSEEVLDPDALAWDKAAATRVLLNRTPRVYQTEPILPTSPPALEVRGLRIGEKVVLRLRWNDATRDAPEAPPSKQATGGDPSKLYKRPTGETGAFADAAAIMVPDGGSEKKIPSLVMGDRHTPARLYYWNASRGADRLIAKGRATQVSTGKSFPHRARHADGHWMLTADIGKAPAGCPIAFAVWNGHDSNRDGLKFFSIWYVLKEGDPAPGG